MALDAAGGSRDALGLLLAVMADTSAVTRGPSAPELMVAMPTDTSEAEVEQSLARLRERATAFARARVSDKVTWLREMSRGFRHVAAGMVRDACRAKGVELGTPLEGEEWLAGLLPIVRNLKQLAESLDHIQRRGLPRIDESRVHGTADGRTAVTVTPHEPYDAWLYAPFRAQTWLAPSSAHGGALATRASFYQRREPEGRVALVLGGGNVASIPVLDVMHKSFVEGSTCLLKMSPVNAYLGPYFEIALAPLISRGFLRIVYGGSELGARLVQAQEIDELHITGSDETHDRIVWGERGAERDARKKNDRPLFTKRVTSELGNVSPVLIVPGEYDAAELRTMARGIAGMIVQNASFNCNAAKILVTPRGFAQRKALLECLQAELSRIPPRLAYYPGARERYEALTRNAENVQRIGDARGGELPWTLITGLEAESGAPQFRVEPFCSVLSEVSVGSADPAEFMAAATEFANESLWGTLNAMLYVAPASERDAAIAKALDTAIAGLRYGTVAVNHWPASSYALATSPWGGYPGSSLADVQSGIGWVHNSLMLEGVEKTVQRGKLRAFPEPPYFPRHRSLHRLGRALFDFEAAPSALGFARVGYFAVRG